MATERADCDGQTRGRHVRMVARDGGLCRWFDSEAKMPLLQNGPLR
jgi:hypothetical protein